MAVCLNEHSELQVQSYLRFAKGNREENMREVSQSFDDVREYKLLDAVYTKDDVRALVDELADEVRSTVEKELQNNVHVAAAMLKSVFAQAEEAGCTRLTIDTNALEEIEVLNDIKATEKVALARPASDFVAARASQQRRAALSGLTDAPQLKTLGRETNALQSRMENLNTAASNDVAAGLRAELAAAKKEMSRRLQESAQFQQMKKMMMQKTKELQAARKKLRKYEPDSEGDMWSADNDDDEFLRPV